MFHSVRARLLVVNAKAKSLLMSLGVAFKRQISFGVWKGSSSSRDAQDVNENSLVSWREHEGTMILVSLLLRSKTRIAWALGRIVIYLGSLRCQKQLARSLSGTHRNTIIVRFACGAQRLDLKMLLIQAHPGISMHMQA